jgi:hypothetical protein
MPNASFNFVMAISQWPSNREPGHAFSLDIQEAFGTPNRDLMFVAESAQQRGHRAPMAPCAADMKGQSPLEVIPLHTFPSCKTLRKVAHCPRPFLISMWMTSKTHCIWPAGCMEFLLLIARTSLSAKPTPMMQMPHPLHIRLASPANHSALMPG